MKTYMRIAVFCVFMMLSCSMNAAFAQEVKAPGFILEHENEIAVEQPGPHDGTGMTTGYSFFSKASGLKLVFRKRVLHRGASIGYHLQGEDEIYYVVSGKGEMKMNGKMIQMKAGDAMLTRPGSFHGLTQVGVEDLVIIISYEQKEKK